MRTDNRVYLITDLKGQEINYYIANKLSNVSDTDGSIKALWSKLIWHTWYYNIQLIDSTYEIGLYYTVNYNDNTLQQNTFKCHGQIISIDTIKQTIEKYSILGVKRIFIQNVYNENGITYVSWFKTDTTLPEMEFEINPAFFQ